MYNDFSDCNTAAQYEEKAKKLQREREEQERITGNIEIIKMNSIIQTNVQNEMIAKLKQANAELEYLNSLQTRQLMKLNQIFDNQELNHQLENQILELLKEKYEPNHPIWEQLKDVSKSSLTGIVAETAIIALKQLLKSTGIIL